MNQIIIDETKCVHCRICGAVCPRIASMIAEKLKRLLPVLFPVGRFANKGVRKMLSAYPELCKAMKQELSEMTAAWDEGDDRILRNAPNLIIA